MTVPEQVRQDPPQGQSWQQRRLAVVSTSAAGRALSRALGKLWDWLKYERLKHYPALATFEREAALTRLRAYEREEREACQPWLKLLWGFIFAGMVTWFIVSYFHPLVRAFSIVAQAPAWVLQFALHRRIQRRVQAKVAAELRDGRLWKCVECDSDLRASEERCPECGAAIWVTPPRIAE